MGSFKAPGNFLRCWRHADDPPVWFSSKEQRRSSHVGVADDELTGTCNNFLMGAALDVFVIFARKIRIQMLEPGNTRECFLEHMYLQFRKRFLWFLHKSVDSPINIGGDSAAFRCDRCIKTMFARRKKWHQLLWPIPWWRSNRARIAINRVYWENIGSI